MGQISRDKIAAWVIGVALASGAPGTAFAQDAASENAGEQSAGEIVITAAKRSQRLQDVPISVTALDGADLARSRIDTPDNLVTQVANLQVANTIGASTPIFALRGVSMADFSLNQSSPVAIYYDEVYKGNFAFLGVSFYDLERIEVLRGPQGTLYGKNTTGGAVNLITRTAEIGETDGYLNVGIGNYDRYEANGAVSIPMGDKLAARVAFTFARADGWFKNQLPGAPDLDSVREYAFRGSLLFEPTDGVSFTLRAATSYQNPYNYGIYAQPEEVHRSGLDRRELESAIDARRRARAHSVALTANIDLSDSLAFTSITSWDKGRLYFYEDTDGVASQLLEIQFVDRATQFTQDFRLTSTDDGPFQFIAGAYFNREKVFNQTIFELGKDIDFDGVPGGTEADCAIGFPLACVFSNRFDQLKKSLALYTDLSFQVTGALKVRGGLRFTHDTGRQTDFQSDALGANGGFVTTMIPNSSLKFKTNNLSGKIGLDYEIDGQLIYASFSRGYRGDSFNAQAFFDPSELSVAKPEKVNAWEIGAKTQFADRTITLNVAAFYYDYRNQQFINVDPVTAAQNLFNIPKSRIMGGEAELSIRASRHLTFRSGLGLLDSKIKKGSVSGVDVAGNELANAPALSINGGIDATVLDADAGKLSLHGDISYVSSQYFEVVNVPRLKQKGYAVLGGHIDFESADGRWNASIWGKNLTNKFYFTSRIDLLAGFGYDYNHISAPRTFGITLGHVF